MKKKKTNPKLSEFFIGMGISAGILGLMGAVLKDQMDKLKEMMQMDGVSVKEVIAGMVSAYNDIIEEKNAEIKELEETISRKDADISSLKAKVEEDLDAISDLNEKIKEIKAGKKKDKKNVKEQPVEEKPEPKLM